MKAIRPLAGESLGRMTLSRASEEKAAQGKISDEKKVSIAWVIRDAIKKHLSDEAKKPEA